MYRERVVRAKAVLVSMVVGAVGCFDPHYDQPRCLAGECPSGLTCSADGFCRGPDEVIDGAAVDVPSVDAVPGDAPIDGNCVTSCDPTSTILTTCGPSGPTDEVCAQGCASAPVPHCRTFSPSNGATIGDLVGVSTALAVSAGRLFWLDTDDGSIDSFDLANPSTPPIAIRGPGTDVIAGISFRLADQGGAAPGLAIWGVASVTVAGGASLPQHGTMRFVGSRAAIVLARGSITVHGAIDVGGGRSPANAVCRSCGGPGGGNGGTRATAATGCAPGGNGAYDEVTSETGGAGGGMSTPGANGGDDDALGGVASGVGVCATPLLVPLTGGGGGGRGGFDGTGTPFGGAEGGGGGGALQLTSLVAITIAGGADLYAAGVGGEGSDLNYGGGGGGAGGAFLLEAPMVTIADMARVTANGGAGGSGRTANGGESGNRSTTRASGGLGDGAGGDSGRGGRGGVAADTATATLLATPGSGAVDGTGGGGASAGRIRVNTSASTAPAIASSTTISPPASTGTRALE